MNLVKISEGTFVNPERIDAITSGSSISVIINGVPYTVKDHTTLITNLMKVGLDYHKDFFAG